MIAATRPAPGPAKRVLARLTEVTRTGEPGSWIAVCPVHANDASPSLTVRQAKDGRVVLECSKGCKPGVITRALGLEIEDLYPPKPTTPPPPPPAASPPPARAEQPAGPTPPFHADAEQAVLAAGIMTATAIADARAIVGPKDFYRDAHQRIFAAQLTLADRGQPAEPMLLAEELEKRGELGGVGGKDYLGDLIDAVPSAANVRYYAGLVREYARRREVMAKTKDAYVAAETGAASAVEIAQLLTADIQPIATDTGGARGRFKVFSVAEIQEMPPIAWLITGILPEHSMAMLYGQPGAGKSFVALDLAMCIATGRDWLKHSVRTPGAVLYLAAEGAPGMRARVSAWLAAHRATSAETAMHFVVEPANLMDPTDAAHVERAIQSVGAPVRLVVIDTLHRSMAGGDENSARDVGLVLDHADRIRRTTGATVLIVHHSKKDSDTERGSGALRGAVDTLISVRDDEDRRLIVCEKQKDGAGFDPIPIVLESYHDSCVARLLSDSENLYPLNSRQRELLHVLQRDFQATGATTAEWKSASRFAESSYHRVKGMLLRRDYVRAVEKGNSSKYVVTAAGYADLVMAGLVTANGKRTPTALTDLSHDSVRAVEPPDLWPENARNSIAATPPTSPRRAR